MTLTRHRTFQYVGILLVLGLIAVGYWYFAVRAGVKTNTSGSQPQGTGDLSAGLVGYWKLDENTGTSAADSSTNGSSGTLTNGPTWTTGQIGSAVNFDGTNDYITDSGATAVDIRGSISLASWVKFDTLPTSGQKKTLIRNMLSGNHLYEMKLFNNAGTYELQFTAGGGTDQSSAVAVSIATGTWYHMAVTYDTVLDKVSLYFNGALMSQQTETVTGGYAGGTGTLYFGSENGTGSYLDGQMDEIRIYDRALSSDEMASMYRLTAPTGVDTSLKGYWSFNGDAVSGTTAYDRSGAGNTGTLTNGPTTADGRIGQALDFDGSDDQVNVGSATALDDMNLVTMCAWAKPDAIGVDPRIYAKADANGQNGIGINLTETTNRFEFRHGWTGAAGARWDSSDNSVVIGAWQHLCATYDGSNTANDPTLYINGVSVPITEVSSPSGTLSSDASYDAIIGNRPDGARPFEGGVDEVRVYNRILSAAEIKSLYDRGSADKTNTSAGQAGGTGRLDSGLTGYWKLDENSGTSAADASVNGNTGTLTNGPTWTTGQIGGAVDFDGTNDHVSFATKIPRKGTISAWVNTTEALDLCTYSNVFSAVVPGSHIQLQFNSCSVGYNLWAFLYRGNYGTYADVSGPTYTSTSEYQGWHHLTATWDDAAGATLYIDGTLAGSSTTTTGVIDDATAATGYMGSDSGTQDFYSGKIDETRLYDRILSADEVAQLYRLTAPTGVDTSLKGYWSFNGQDVSGTTAYDRSGAGNNGTLTNGPAIKWGRVGQALNFDGTNDSVTIVDSTALKPAVISVAAWFRANTTQVSTNYGGIVSKAETSGYFLEIDIDGTDCGTAGNLCGGFYAGGAYRMVDTPVSRDVWHHAVVSYDGSTVQLYLDGVLADTTSYSGSITHNTEPLCIGADATAGTCSESFFTGAVDEARIYNRVLSAAEVKAQYDAAAPDKTNTSVSTPQGTGNLDSGLAGYWKLDEGSGTSAADASTNGFTGTLTNGPTWTTGQIGSAVDFDGTDDYISLGTTLVSADSITVAAWVKADAAVDGMPIIGQINGEEGSNHQCLFYDNAGTENIIFGNGAGGAVNIQVTGTGASLGTTWHHVVYTNSGTTNSIYLDGTRLVQTVSTALSTNTESNITIGRCWSGGGASYFNGLIDDVRIYRRTLSADEVGQLYRLGTPTGTDTGLKGYWSFNGQDISGTTAYDRSGAGNNGTLSGGPTMKWGKLGQALSFNGSTQSVDFGVTGYPLDTFSESFWVKTSGTITLFTESNSLSNVDGVTGQQFALMATRGSSSIVAGAVVGSGVSVGTNGIQVGEFTNSYFPILASYSGSLGTGWNHVVVVYNSRTPSIYLNGQLVRTGLTSQRTGITPSYVLADGEYGDFAGSIDEVRLYSRSLSASEIKALYSSGK